ncbi:hypothetical protein D3C85_1915180 [compost metagenome]
MQLDVAAHGDDARGDALRVGCDAAVHQLAQCGDVGQDVLVLVLEFVDVHGLRSLSTISFAINVAQL